MKQTTVVFQMARIFVLRITVSYCWVKDGTKRGNSLDRRKSTNVVRVLISLCSCSLTRRSLALLSSLKFSLHYIIVQSYNEMLIMVNVVNFRQLRRSPTITEFTDNYA